MEALIALLHSMHQTTLKQDADSSNRNCSPKCPSHKVFELIVEETVICECNAEKKSLWDYSTFAHHFYVNEIFEDLVGIDYYGLLSVKEEDIVNSISASSVMKCESRLHEYIRRQWEGVVFKMCPSDCNNPRSKKILKLIESPKVFMINLIWKDFKPHLLKILQVYASIPYCVSMDNIYNYKTPTTHVLKSVIFYGSGHYICAIRAGRNKLWHKIDDEMGKKVGDGSWKDLVFDSLKSRFYPVGIFYEESPLRDINNITAQDWLEIERTLLSYLKKNQDPETSDWNCACGVTNDGSWKVCSVCNKIKPGVEGWVCKDCTFINQNFMSYCRSCEAKKVNEDDEKVWECKCGKKNRNGDNCVCGDSKKCKICSKKIFSRCSDCYTGYECCVCKELIPKTDGKICYRCKGKANTKCDTCSVKIFNSQLVCLSCTKLLKKCGYCDKFNLPGSEKCSNDSCLKILRDLSPAINNLNDKPCVDCGRKKKSCICDNELKCSLCCISIKKNGICYKCLEPDSATCDYCTSGSKNKYLICQSCTKSLKKCKICLENTKTGPVCEKPECQSKYNSISIERQSIPSTLQRETVNKISNTKEYTNCRVCDRELCPSYRYCLNCKLKLTTPTCKFCSCPTYKEFCELCIRSTQLCRIGNHRYHIINEVCPICPNK